MKKFIVILYFLLFPTISVIAGETNFWLEGQGIHSRDGKDISQVNGGLSGNISGPVGYFVFGQTISTGYRQIYGGPTLKPFSWLEVGVAGGQETGGTPNRRAAYLWSGNDSVSVIGIFENGGSGPWHKIVVNYRVSNSVGIGIMDQAFLGRGPRMEYSLNKNVTLWGAVLHDKTSNSTNSTFAVNFSF